eukprot:Lankesteria_metandrocarpae@DN4466_c1_g1_i3.p1
MGQVVSGQCCCGKRQYTLSANDLDLFTEAHRSNDIPMLLKLMDSEQEFQISDTKIHPWAAPPRTIGALAISQLASLASQPSETPVSTMIREAGGIEKMVHLLDSNAIDKVHGAVIALSFLSDESPQNAGVMYEANALTKLVKCMHMQPNDLKAAAALTCRNIYTTETVYRQAFVGAGGVQPLVDLLALPEEPFDSKLLHVQAEAVLCLEDLMIEDGTEIVHCVAAVKDCGGSEALRILSEVKGNSELSKDAHSLLIHVAE